MSVKLHRVKDSPGHYATADGRYEVWQEPYDVRHWYANDTTIDETLWPEGFRTKREAVEFLAKWVEKHGDDEPGCVS